MRTLQFLSIYMDKIVSDIGSDFSIDVLSKKSFAQLALFWSVAIVSELTVLDRTIDWPLVSVREDTKREEFKLVPQQFEALMTRLREERIAREASSLFMRKELFIADRLEIMSEIFMADMKRIINHMNTLLDFERKLLFEKILIVEDLEQSLPSPRSLKRRPKVSPRSDVAQSLVRIRFELFLIDRRIAQTSERISEHVIEVHAMINLVSHSRKRAAHIFAKRIAAEIEECEQSTRKIHALESILHNVFITLQMKADSQ